MVTRYFYTCVLKSRPLQYKCFDDIDSHSVPTSQNSQQPGQVEPYLGLRAQQSDWIAPLMMPATWLEHAPASQAGSRCRLLRLGVVSVASGCPQF